MFGRIVFTNLRIRDKLSGSAGGNGGLKTIARAKNLRNCEGGESPLSFLRAEFVIVPGDLNQFAEIEKECRQVELLLVHLEMEMNFVCTIVVANVCFGKEVDLLQYFLVRRNTQFSPVRKNLLHVTPFQDRLLCDGRFSLNEKCTQQRTVPVTPDVALECKNRRSPANTGTLGITWY